VKAWQNRALSSVYPIVYLDAIHVKLRNSGRVESCAVYVALAVNLEGNKELLGLWIGEAEGAKFWLAVLTELQSRGVEDILIACIDGLLACPPAARPGRMRVQRPQQGEGLEDEKATQAGADRTEVA